MNPIILTLRITRRAIGAAAINKGEMTLLDGRHLNSTPDRTIPAALRYIDKLVQLTHPTCVVIDAPGHHEASSTTARLLGAALARFHARGVPVTTVSRIDLLSAFGVTRLIDRREVRELARILWPDVRRVTGKVEPYVADAAAAAGYAECRLEIGPPLL